MSDVSVETEGLRAFGATNAAIAGDIAGAGNMDVVASVSAMTPVFGLIGADYLLSFAAAQVLQARDINDLSDKYTKLSQAAFSSAANYDVTDLGNAGDLGKIAGEIGGAL
ncbi:ESX-1 secretion-associated protein [Nocardia cyriacigeorgica]|uniref:ESX-1 secretion-associated protein n=1 Tax=Nocardia cyriacigeorgica TaxID=135487 RepID=A0A6P1D1V8_9NOCA|nr:type VII secretion target [Nocardia cyriacigeorgica]NEW40524.1 ESX-1 secretion-associated protein [Nocardia cyriacigeorgica]NEW43023.1 ESX-1 secretion-associated protein [Nocardia cyriacigeorgica]NEW51681.1 ESX-1 secretion-associated protein [Nocardia cyriacigeorgica]NEW55491.1 ESX-1 secretion-associated protein [Nocardia cyriacigeorgica]